MNFNISKMVYLGIWLCSLRVLGQRKVCKELWDLSLQGGSFKHGGQEKC